MATKCPGCSKFLKENQLEKILEAAAGGVVFLTNDQKKSIGESLACTLENLAENLLQETQKTERVKVKSKKKDKKKNKKKEEKKEKAVYEVSSVPPDLNLVRDLQVSLGETLNLMSVLQGFPSIEDEKPAPPAPTPPPVEEPAPPEEEAPPVEEEEAVETEDDDDEDEL